MDNAFYANKLKNFMDGEERLKSYPKKFKLKIIALLYLATKFTPDKIYSENEVNEILQGWHTFNDWTMLRRELCDKGFLYREIDGSSYWTEANAPALATFGLE